MQYLSKSLGCMEPGNKTKTKNKKTIMFMLSDNIFFSLLRTQSVILISSDDEVLFYERTMEGANWLENKYEFNIESVG